MQLLSAWILGVLTGSVIGVACMALLKRRSIRRTRRHMHLASFVMNMSNMSRSDVKRLFPKDSFPPWIVFGKHEKTDWINKELDVAWPFIEKAICPILKASVESTVDLYKPSIFAALKFHKFTLGMVPPRVSGVMMTDSLQNEISMEAEFQWSMKSNIILGIWTSLGIPQSVQIKDVTMTGTLLFSFKPLTDDFPCFHALTYSLRDLRTFNLDVELWGGNVPAIPGLLSMVEEMIKTVVEDTLVWPRRQIFKVHPGEYRDLELHPTGILHVKLIEARNLLNKDIIGKSDPFVLLYIRSVRNHIQKSKTIYNDLFPIWNETFKFEIEDLSSQSLFVKVLDEEELQEAEFLGCAKIELKKLTPGKMIDFWVPLVEDFSVDYPNAKTYRGELHLELVYISRDGDILNSLSSSSMHTNLLVKHMTSLEKAFSSKDYEMSSSLKNMMNPRDLKDVTLIRGVLSIMHLRADGLMLRKAKKALDPYVLLKMEKSKIVVKTEVVFKTFQPEWKENFHLLVKDGLHEMLIIEIWDQCILFDRFLGKCVLTLTSLLRQLDEEIKEIDVDLQGVKSGKLFLQYRWAGSPIRFH